MRSQMTRGLGVSAAALFPSSAFFLRRCLRRPDGREPLGGEPRLRPPRHDPVLRHAFLRAHPATPGLSLSTPIPFGALTLGSLCVCDQDKSGPCAHPSPSALGPHDLAVTIPQTVLDQPENHMLSVLSELAPPPPAPSASATPYRLDPGPLLCRSVVRG